MHITGNHLAEIVGDRAVSETYGTAVHWGTPADDPALNFTSGFRYVDELVREDGRMADRGEVRAARVDTCRRRPPRSGRSPGPRGSRDRSDPVYRLLGDLRA